MEFIKYLDDILSDLLWSGGVEGDGAVYFYWISSDVYYVDLYHIPSLKGY
jgi:hypothetical protein